MEAWRRWQLPGRLVVAGSPLLFADRPDLRALAGSTSHGRIDIDSMPTALSLEGLPLLQKGWHESRLLGDVLAQHRPRQALAMSGDHTQFALAIGRHIPSTVQLSLLLLRVSHHRPVTPTSFGSRFTKLRKRSLLSLAARSPRAGAFLTSDPAAVTALRALGANGVYIPDPVPLPACTDQREAVRNTYRVASGRKLFLVYGALAERKGVFTILEAVRRLPQNVAANTAVLFAGPIQSDIAGLFLTRLEAMRLKTPAQLLLHDAFLHEAETCALLRASDVVLAPYLNHSGTSSVLIRAAGARRPVISQREGLMGEQVTTHCLGQTIDASDPADLARALQTEETGFEPDRAFAFAQTQTPEAYARATFDALGLSQ